MTSSTPPFHSSSLPSSSSSVPPFHSLGNGTVEQDQVLRNTQSNTAGTSSLKVLANKVLEQNKKWNKPGTAASESVPLISQSSPVCGTGAGTDYVTRYDALSYEFEERAAIAEYDGNQTPLQAERIAYQDAFISVLTILHQEAYESSHGEDWLDARITAAKECLQAQNLFQPK